VPSAADHHVCREVDEVLGLTATAGKRLEDSRTGCNTRLALLPLIRQSIYSRLAGYENVNDAERLYVDPAMRHIVGGRASQPEKMAASSSELGRLETDILARRSNIASPQGILSGFSQSGEVVGSNTSCGSQGRAGRLRVAFTPGFIVTILALQARTSVTFYTGRGTAGQCDEEGKTAVRWTRFS